MPPASFRLPLLALALALAGCDRTPPGPSGPAVQPVVLPPHLAQTHVAPETIDRVATVQVALKEPQALPATQVDAFKQSDGVVDILWLIDNSGSMADERTQLAGNFTRFIQTLAASQTDFHIATITTDADLGAALHGSTPIIDRTTADPTSAFLDQVTFPAGRVKWVQGLAMMQKFLATPALNAAFLRPGAALAVIAVSDGDDQSFGGVPYYARFLRGVKGQGNENLASFSTISGDVPNGCQSARDVQYWGSRADASIRYTEMARRTGGVVGSICDLSFENTLVSIAQALNTLRKIFPLSLKPDPSTISVKVNGVPVPNDPTSGWTFVATVRAIEFLGSFIPPPGADVEIQYAIAS